MCGRFENKMKSKDIIEYLRGYLEIIDECSQIEFKRTNIAPSLQIQTIIKENDTLYLRPTTWGIEFGKKSPFIINTRAETIRSKSNWRKAAIQNRSLVPMTAFYEWKQDEKDKKKTPYRISLPGNDLFLVPAITLKIDNEYCTSLITTEPNKSMSTIHNRMPVIMLKYTIGGYFNLDESVLLDQLHPLNNDVVMDAEKNSN